MSVSVSASTACSPCRCADRGRDCEVVLLLDPAPPEIATIFCFGRRCLISTIVSMPSLSADDVADHQIEARVVDRGEPGGAGLGLADVVA